MTSENHVDGRGETGIPELVAGAAPEEFRPLSSLVHAALGRPAHFDGGGGGDSGHGGKDVSGGGPQEPRGRACRRPTTSTPSAPGPSSRRWPAPERGSSSWFKAWSVWRWSAWSRPSLISGPSVRPLPLPDDQGTEVEALRRAVLELTARALELAHPEGGFNIDQLAAQAPDPLDPGLSGRVDDESGRGEGAGPARSAHPRARPSG